MPQSVILEDRSVLVPEGEYELRCINYETRVLYGPKLILNFEVVNDLEHEGLELNRYYNVASFIGRPSERGAFRVGPRSSFFREYVAVFGPVQALQSVDVEDYLNRTVVGRIVTVRRGSQGSTIPESLQYSVVSELLRMRVSPALEQEDELDEYDDYGDIDDE